MAPTDVQIALHCVADADPRIALILIDPSSRCRGAQVSELSHLPFRVSPSRRPPPRPGLRPPAPPTPAMHSAPFNSAAVRLDWMFVPRHGSLCGVGCS
jgi:hypothetical protein